MSLDAHPDQGYWNGDWQTLEGEVEWVNKNPSTEEDLIHCRSASSRQVDDSVKSARAAFPEWRESAIEDRATVLESVADRLEQNMDSIARHVTEEIGTPIAKSGLLHAQTAIRVFRRTAHYIRRASTETKFGTSLVENVPVGVVACITPWNYPLYLAACKVAPALAAGCTVVLKPSEQSPVSIGLLTDAIAQTGLQPGVFNLVPGDGRGVGQRLIGSPDVDMVSFTGSVAAGRNIAESAGKHPKAVTMELGGKSPTIVLDEKCLGQAVNQTMLKLIQNSGQTCAALSLLIVPKKLLSKTENLVAQVVDSIKVGDPLQELTMMGPVVNRRQLEGVRQAITTGIDQGARLICGGAEPPDHLHKGYFVRPTAFSDVTTEMELFQNEIFGPVLSIATFDGNSADQAIELANSTQFGLSGAVWADEETKAVEFAKRLRAGSISINGAPTNPDAPFGGFKQSGFGRERGPWGIEEFQTTKAMHFNEDLQA